MHAVNREDGIQAAGGHAMPPGAEQLSAWADGELPAAEMELLAARLRRTGAGEAAARIARYALVGAVLRGEPAALPANKLVRRVALVLAAGAVANDPGSRTADDRWPWPAAGLAASLLLALAVIVTLAPGPGSAPVPAVAAVTTGAAPPARLAAGTALADDQLTNYLVYHGEYSGTLAGKLVDSHIVGHHPALAVAGLP